MKSRYLLMGLWLAAAAAFVPQAAAAAGEQITGLAITATLSKADVLDVTEQVNYDFGSTAPHAIMHDIPLSYQDDQGRQFPVTFHLLGAGATSTVAGAVAHLSIPPGSRPGPHRYELHYTLAPVVLNGPTNDVLKFSATGLGWTVPVAQVTLKLRTPAPAANLTCYTGSGATTTANCRISQAGDAATIVTDASLPPGQDVTLYGNFPSRTFSAYLQPSDDGPSWVTLGLLAAALLALIVAAAVWLARRPRPVSPDLDPE